MIHFWVYDSKACILYIVYSESEHKMYLGIWKAVMAVEDGNSEVRPVFTVMDFGFALGQGHWLIGV